MASSALAWVFSLEQVGQSLAASVVAISDNKYLFLLLLNVLFLGLGCLLEGTALMIVLVPLLMPTVVAMGIDPVHFGIILIVNLSVGTLTPPIGTVMLVVCNITKVNVAEFTRQSLGLYAALLIGLVLITYVPEISLLLSSGS